MSLFYVTNKGFQYYLRMRLDFFPILLKTFQIQFEVRNINQGVAD